MSPSLKPHPLLQQKRHPYAWNGMNTPLQAAPILIVIMNIFAIAASIFQPSLIVITRQSIVLTKTRNQGNKQGVNNLAACKVTEHSH